MITYSSTPPGYPSSIAIYHGQLVVSYPESNYIYIYNGEGSLKPLINVDDPVYIVSNNYDLYIKIGNNGSLLYYNGSINYVNINKTFMIFYDSYNNLTYVTTENCYVYELNGTSILHKYFVYESFGYMTFTNTAAIVDSVTGYTLLFYNGTNHTTVNCQDALSGMGFTKSYFISGSYSPQGIFVFHNLSVLKLNLINDNLFPEIANYNISFISTTVEPDFIQCLNGVLYVASDEGLNAIDLRNSQVFYSSYVPVYSMITYNGSIYAATSEGVIRYNLNLPPLYNLKIEASDFLQKNQGFSVLLNGTKYESSQNQMDFCLAQGYYNITFLPSYIEKPNVSSILVFLNHNYSINVNYTKPFFYLKINVYGDNDYVQLNVNGSTETFKRNLTTILPAGTYIVSLTGKNYSFAPKMVEVPLIDNTTLNFYAKPVISHAIETSSQTISTSPLSNPLNVGLVLIVAAAIVLSMMSFFIIRGRPR